jgi:hypothetical protein
MVNWITCPTCATDFDLDSIGWDYGTIEDTLSAFEAAENADQCRSLLSLWLEHYDELGDGTPTVSLDELAQRTRKLLDE